MTCYKFSMTPLMPVRTEARKPLAAEAAGRLREHLLAGGAGSGGSLPSEARLGKALGVSRTVLREALKILEGQGLVELSQGRRARLRPAHAEAAIGSLDLMLRRAEGSLADLVEVRRPLESEIAALAAVRAGDEHLRRASRALDELRQAATLAARVEADVRFHRILAEAAGNPLFVLLLDVLAGLLQRSRVRSIGRFGVQAALAGHRRILAALRRRDSEAARRAMLAHLDWNRRQLVEDRK
jgi:GntR family transcriptional repressor for pyruvate dehydrogenase complex